MKSNLVDGTGDSGDERFGRMEWKILARFTVVRVA